MAKDLTVILKDEPGTLAELGQALGGADINIDGMCGFPCQGEGVLHILVDDAAGARHVIEAAGFEVRSERDVLLYEAPDQPGMLGDVARRIAEAGVNIELLYKATQTQLVIGVDDLQTAKAAL